jgi:hypothetical protein
VPDPENPVRALALAGVVLAALLASCVATAGWMLGTIHPELLGMVALGSAAYLAQKPGRFFKVASGAVAGATALALVLAAGCAVPLWLYRHDDVSGLEAGQVLLMVVRGLLVAAAVVGASWVATKTTSAGTRRQTTVGAVFAGEAYLVLDTVLTVVFFPDADFVAQGLGGIPYAVALGLSVKLTAMLCLFKSRRMTVGAGPKVWFWICLVFTSGATIAMAVLAEQSIAFGGAIVGWVPDYFVLPLYLTVVAGYILLVRSRRLGYVLVLLGTGVMLFGQFADVVWVALSSGDASAALNLATVVTGALNPTITGLILLAAWKTVPVEPAFAKRPVPVIFKIGAVSALVIGLLIFLILCTAAYAEINSGMKPSGQLVVAVALGGTISLVALFGLVSCFDKRSKGSRGLLVTTLVLGALPVAAVLIGLIVALVQSAGDDTAADRQAPRARPAVATQATDQATGGKEDGSGDLGDILPESLQSYNNQYTVTSFDIGVDEEGHSKVIVKGSGFNTLPFRNGKIVFPVDCYLITASGQEIGWSSVQTTDDGVDYMFPSKVDAIKVKFAPADGSSDGFEIPIDD